MLAKMTGNWGMEQAISLLKDEKMSIGVLGALVFMAYVGFVWADSQHQDYQTKAEAAQADRELKALIAGNAETAGKVLSKMDAHVKDFEAAQEEARIEYAKATVRDMNTELRLAQTDPSTTEREMENLVAHLEQAKEYRDCLINRKPNCQHLRPVE